MPRRPLMTVLVALAAALAIAAPAAAHSALIGSSPEEGATVAELTQVSLEFNEQLLEIGHELVLEGPDGTRTALVPDEAITTVITAPVPDAAQVAGAQVLHWRVVSADGHPIEGQLSFTYDPPATAPSPTPTATVTATATATPDPTPSASPSAGASPSASPGASPEEAEGAAPLGWIAAAAAAVAAVGTAIALTVRRRREA